MTNHFLLFLFQDHHLKTINGVIQAVAGDNGK